MKKLKGNFLEKSNSKRLMEAIKAQNAEDIRKYIEMGVDLNEPYGSGHISPTFYASIQLSNANDFALFLNNGGDIY